MQDQILEEKQGQKEESAVTIVEPKQAIEEMLVQLKNLKTHKDDLLFPIKDELEEIEEKVKHIVDEITLTMREANKNEITLSNVRTNDGVAIFKLPPKPHKFYKKEKLDAITEPEIRRVLDTCLEDSKQGEPSVKLEVY